MFDPNPEPTEDLSRFEVSRGTLWVDRGMGWLVNGGGVVVIVAVLGILIYLLGVVAPLFKGAHVEEKTAPVALGAMAADKLTLAASETGGTVLIYNGGNEVRWLDTAADKAPEVRSSVLPIPEGATVTAWKWRPFSQTLGIALDSGEVALLKVRFAADGAPQFSEFKAQPLAPGGGIEQIGFAVSGGEELLAGIVNQNGARSVRILSLKEKKGLVGKGTISVDLEQDATGLISGGAPTGILVSQSMREIIVRLDTGSLALLGRTGKEFVKRQDFAPFTAEEGTLSGLDFVFGDASIVTTSTLGDQKIFSLMVPEGAKLREFRQTKELPGMGGAQTAFASSLRNKSYLSASGSKVSLRHATTESTRWEKDVGIGIVAAALNGKNDRFFLLDVDGGLHAYDLEDHYPDSGWRAFFGKVWYEGQNAPAYLWQSSSSNDDYEPKFSMVPLIFGTLKATLYSMLISVPIALLAAIYTSQFLSHGAKRIVKPAMEIMASLPSVVLGFLAAFWLAPLIQYKIPSVISAMILTPLSVVTASFLWNSLPTRTRNRIPKGMEYLFLVPVVILGAILGWKLGGPLEAVAFRAPDPATGQLIPDFTLWWTQKRELLPLAPLLTIMLGFPALFFLLTGRTEKLRGALGKFTTPVLAVICLGVAYGVGMLLQGAFPDNFAANQYEQRNATVVGFMMGFAVIPVIFTIAEDALSNVPGQLSAAGFAMGASRWQVMRMVVLPTAAAGIFSALMIGFGRAVGETMVVVMAAGNTPVMEWNPFNGMRPLSANLAVELPEAAQGSTHFRALHLGALILFVLTFVLNTIAEVVRQHLRNKFKTN